MTARADATRKYDKRKARTIMQDMFNTYAFSCDQAFKSNVENVMQDILTHYRAGLNDKDCVSIWTDGSYNTKAKTAGIGIVVSTKSNNGSYQLAAFGKTVKADTSVKAEIYALAIGISYLLDTYPQIQNARIHYDCMNATVCMTNIEAYTPFGAPYTNFRSALKRARKQNMNISFEHVKAHMDSRNNDLADLIAKYYAKAQLDAKQVNKISKYVHVARRNNKNNKK